MVTSFLSRFISFFTITLILTSLSQIPSTAFGQAQSEAEAEAEADAMQAQSQAEAKKEAKRAAPPSALPGAESDNEDPEHARIDLNPTAALFDAINKGSLIAAKEALNRGADINSHNAIDQTPLDMSIDLGRNDIMFLLLSLRTYNPEGYINKPSSYLKEKHIHKSSIEEKHQLARQKIALIKPTRKKEKTLADTRHPEAGFLGFKYFNE